MTAPAATAPAATARRVRRSVVIGAGLLLLVIGIVLSAGIGQLPIGPPEVVGSLLRAAGIDNAWAPVDPLIEQTLWQIRLPRVVMSVAVGALN